MLADQWFHNEKAFSRKKTPWQPQPSWLWRWSVPPGGRYKRLDVGKPGHGEMRVDVLEVEAHHVFNGLTNPKKQLFYAGLNIDYKTRSTFLN